jgi:hypothetical protein
LCERSAPARWHWSNVRYCSERGANRNDYRDATMVLVAYRHESTPCATPNCRRTLRQVRKPGYSSVVMAECSREGTLVRTVLAQASDLSADSAGAYPALPNGISRQTTYFRTRTASPPLCPAANGGWLPSTNAARADSAASVRHMLTHTTGSRQHLWHCVRSSTTCGRTATTGARKPMQHSDSWPKGRPSDPGGNGSPADATGRSAVAAYC